MKNLKLVALSLALFSAFSCSDLEVENLNTPNTAEVLSTPADIVSLIEGGIVNLMNTTMSTRVVSMDCQADIITSTNAFRNYWGDSDEPRRRINNTTTWDDRGNIEFMWSGANTAVVSANDIIRFVESEGIDLIVEGTDVTQQTLAAAYMMKGIAQGYLSYIYDKGYVVNFDSDLTALEFVGYQEMAAEAVANLERAISIYNSNAGISFDYITDGGLSAAGAAQLASSYAARFLAGSARTAAERANLDWAKIKSLASNGLTSDWSPTSDENIISNGQHSWNTFIINAEGAAYMPLDLQVTHLADPSSPATFPLDVGAVDPITTDDQRFGLFLDGTPHDFEYTTSIGWLRESRNKSIFSNYSFLRFQYNYQTSNTGNPLHIFTKYENDLLLAEAELHLGNNAAAKAILDAGERVTRGGLAPLADDAFDTIADAIHYENIIGLHSSGAGIALAYMRRWDRLQEGSYLHYPVPASELEITGDELYTFGGAGRGSEDGTATGANSWK